MRLFSLLLLFNGIYSIQFQCTTQSDVDRYYIDSCHRRCECKLSQQHVPVQSFVRIDTPINIPTVHVECYRERPKYDCMTSQQKQDYAQAYLTVSNPSNPYYHKMKEMVLNHSLGFAAIHTTDNFLPWHRAYLAAFEQLLIDGSGNCRVTLPWWGYSDFPTDPFSHPPFGSSPSDLGMNGFGSCVTDGFVKSPWNPPGKTSPTCLVRDYQNPPSMPTYTQMNSIMSQTDYTTFSNQLQTIYHNLPHAIVGGDMATPLSTYDPLFWLLHANVDRNWDLWQRMSFDNMNSYPFPNDVPMPFLPDNMYPMDVNSLEGTHTRYVTVKSVNYEHGYAFFPCKFVHLSSGWFSVEKLETAILQTHLDNLYGVPQCGPASMTRAQQNAWLNMIPPEMRSETSAKFKNATAETRKLASRIHHKGCDKQLVCGMDLEMAVDVLGLEPDCPPDARSCVVHENLPDDSPMLTYQPTRYVYVPTSRPTPVYREWPTRGAYSPPTRSVYSPPTRSVYSPPTRSVYSPPTRSVYSPPTRSVYSPPTRSVYSPPTRAYSPPTRSAYAYSPPTRSAYAYSPPTENAYSG